MAKRNQQDLAERVDAASVKARELKAELEAARQRIADLSAENEANRGSSVTPPSLAGRGRKTARRQTGGRVILAAGLAVSAIALLTWGTATVIHFASSEPIPPSAATSDRRASPAAADLDQPYAKPETPSLSLEPAAGELDPDGAVPPADAQDLAAAQQQIARLTAEVEASDEMITRLRDELLHARQAIETTREAASGAAEAGMSSHRRELMLATAVSTARVIELKRELQTARQRSDEPSRAAARAEKEVVKLGGELPARQQLAAAARLPIAPPDQLPIVNQEGADRTQGADDAQPMPEFGEILTAAEMSSESSTSERDTVSPDDLLLEPGHHFGRQVVVTGPVVWLLRRYWLQSDSGSRSLLIDVEGLHSDARNALKNAVVKIDYLAQVKARITGTVERQGSETYRLAATELVLVE